MKEQRYLMQYLQEAADIILSGGWVMIPLFLLGLTAFYVAARLYLYFRRGNYRKTSLEDCEQWIENPEAAKGQIGEIIRYSQEGARTIDDIQSHFEEIRSAEVPRLEQNLTFLTILVNTAPLLGLLGTVLGMLTTFYGISLGGSEKTTNIVASGIHEALITTQMGLCLAIPGYFVVYFLKQKIIEYQTFLVRLESITLQKLRSQLATS